MADEGRTEETRRVPSEMFTEYPEDPAVVRFAHQQSDSSGRSWRQSTFRESSRRTAGIDEQGAAQPQQTGSENGCLPRPRLRLHTEGVPVQTAGGQTARQLDAEGARDEEQ